jgi:hypothetical protein
MRTPEILLTHFNSRSVFFLRKKWIALLTKNHHKVDPMNSPRTNAMTEVRYPYILVPPKPAKTAAMDRNVTGFVKVTKNVET